VEQGGGGVKIIPHLIILAMGNKKIERGGEERDIMDEGERGKRPKKREKDSCLTTFPIRGGRNRRKGGERGREEGLKFLRYAYFARKEKKKSEKGRSRGTVLYLVSPGFAAVRARRKGRRENGRGERRGGGKKKQICVACREQRGEA